MSYIASYQKVTDAYTTHILNTGDAEGVVELATIDGTTYVSLPDELVLPTQPEEIADSVQTPVMDEQLSDAIKDASPIVALIDKRVAAMIRERYSAEDEIKMLRIAPSDETSAWNSYVESCRSWGRSEKQALGLL